MWTLSLSFSLLTAGCVDPDGTPSKGESAEINETATETGDTDTGHATGILVKPTDTKRIILVIKDTLRSITANDPAVMPYYTKRVAEEGVDLGINFGSGNWTRPAVPAIMTGISGFSLGANTYADDSVDQVPDNVPTLGERFTAAGWSARADLCNAVAYYGEGMRGIDEDNIEVCGEEVPDMTTALDQFERSADWLAEVGDHAVLVMLVMEAHDPFDRPADSCKAAVQAATSQCPGWTGIIEGFSWNQSDPKEDAACKAAVQAAYECDVTKLDEDIEDGFNLLESMGLMDNTVVYMTADHGENMMEPHGDTEDGEELPVGLGHHRLMYSQVSQVDAVMTWKGASPSVISNFPTGHQDVLPTLLDVAGIPYDKDEMEGESVFTLVKDPEVAGNRVITQFACDGGGTDNGAAYMVGMDTYHTILHHRRMEGDTWATYNVTSDPDEATPLVGYDIPEEIRAKLQNQADTSTDWPC